MAHIATLVTLVLALSSQVANGELPAVAPAYGIAPPINPACPDYVNYPPFRYFCQCNLAPCFDAAIAAQLQVIATTYGLNLCDVQQWAVLAQSTMPSIDYASLTGMVDSMAAAVQREMTRQGLTSYSYPPYCKEYFPIVDPVAPSVTPAAPALAKRSPQVTPPAAAAAAAAAAATAADFSPYARSTYYQNMMHLFNRVLPPMSPLLDEELRHSIYGYAPLNYLSYADDLDLKMDLNLRCMMSQMYNYTPHAPVLY